MSGAGLTKLDVRPACRLWALGAIVIGVALAASACQGRYLSADNSDPVTPESGFRDRGDLLGAGATFPSPLYQGWFHDYNLSAPDVRANYQSIGSGAGIHQFMEGVVDFGATDAPMSDADLKKAPHTQHLPTVLGAVAIAYNLPDVTGRLHLDGEVVAGIFLGSIHTWDDPAIAALNPEIRLPATAVTVVHRSDSSGTTFVFTDWLAKVSPPWASKVGKSKAPNWPVGIGGPGNEGMAAILRQSPGAVGYLELNYVAAVGLPAAEIRNGSGEFVGPSLQAAGAAADGIELPQDYRVSLTAAKQPGAYPIASFTYLLIDKQPKECAKARVLLHLLWWIYHAPAASSLSQELSYAPLPKAAQSRVDQTLLSIVCAGKPVLHPPQ